MGGEVEGCHSGIERADRAPSSNLKQCIDGGDGSVAVCCVVKKCPSCGGGTAVDPGFVVGLLRFMEDREDGIPVIGLGCIEEVGAQAVVGWVCGRVGATN
jgi:hypothetical protein